MWRLDDSGNDDQGADVIIIDTRCSDTRPDLLIDGYRHTFRDWALIAAGFVLCAAALWLA